MPFVVPMVWRQPKDNVIDSSFSLARDFKEEKMYSDQPNLTISNMANTAWRRGCLYLNHQAKVVIGEPSCTQYPGFSVSLSSSIPYKITQNEMSDIKRIWIFLRAKQTFWHQDCMSGIFSKRERHLTPFYHVARHNCCMLQNKRPNKCSQQRSQ
ncbi:hypothetical protein PR048_016448 [Dryococelus australis]|uniref:Uncharacterized protein n=1 Tax=Dryococelus australis TaxID=614101 RepID=A0ABQ9HJS2_9NEOP|nr:hypothetical protein PR048_016448 [Dryococelus australis]